MSRWKIVRSILWTACFLAPLLALAGSGLYFRTIAFWRTHSWIDVAAVAFCLLWIVIWSRALVSGITDAFIFRVVPSFERRVGLKELSPFSSGRQVARNLGELDRRAISLGVAPISSFGFDEKQWFDANDGLRTVRVLEDAEPELGAIAVALEKAAEQGIRFCFVLRQGGDEFISPMEMERRRGSFW